MNKILVTLAMIAICIGLIFGVIVPIVNQAKTFGDTNVNDIIKSTGAGTIGEKLGLIKTEIN